VLDPVEPPADHNGLRGGDGMPSAPILVTGPRREMLRGTRLRVEFAAPHGDMMLTGCYGLLRAACERGLTRART